MNSSLAELIVEEARAQNAIVTEDALTVDLVDGRTIIAPIALYPRLWRGTPSERSNLEIIGDGSIIHWPDLDEDLGVAGLLAGQRSCERPESLVRWLEERSSRT